MKIYRGTDDDMSPVEMECDEFGHPNKTTCGETMFINTHFRTEAEAWDSILTSAQAGIELAGCAVSLCQKQMMKAKDEASDAVFRYYEVRKKYEEWKAKLAL